MSDPGAEIPYIKYISTLGALRKETPVCRLSVWSYTETKLNSNKEIEFVFFLNIQINLIELICRKKLYRNCVSICKFQPLKQQYVNSMYERLNILNNFVVQNFCNITLSVPKEPLLKMWGGTLTESTDSAVSGW